MNSTRRLILIAVASLFILGLGGSLAKANLTVGGTVPEPITVLSPNGGETWLIGSTHSVTWHTTNPSIVSITVEYSVDAGTTYLPMVADLPDTSSYSWIVPNQKTGTALIRATAKNISDVVVGTDVSDTVFGIGTQPSPTPTPAATPTPTVAPTPTPGPAGTVTPTPTASTSPTPAASANPDISPAPSTSASPGASPSPTVSTPSEPGVIEKIKETVGNIMSSLEPLQKNVDPALSHPITQIIGVGAGAVAGATAAVAIPVANALASMAATGASSPTTLFPALGLIRPKQRRKYWGRVVSDATGLPIAGASVNLISNGVFTPLYQTVSNLSGGFDLVITTPGDYQLVVTAPGYFSITSPTQALEVIRPEQPITIKLTEQKTQTSLIMARVRKFARFREIIIAISLPIFFIGASLGIYNASFHPALLTFAILVLYVIVGSWNVLTHLFGTVSGPVLDLVSFGPIPEVLIRIAQLDNDSLVIGTTLTDAAGHYRLKLRPGTYVLTATKEGYVPYVSEHFTLGWSNLHTPPIKLEPFITGI